MGKLIRIADHLERRYREAEESMRRELDRLDKIDVSSKEKMRDFWLNNEFPGKK